jgi:hypothetical protein
MGRGVLGDAVDEEDGGGGAVEGLDDGAEGLLPGSVPDLHLHAALGVQADLLGVELDAQGGRVALAELVLGEAVQQAALPHSRRTDYYHLERLLLLTTTHHPQILISIASSAKIINVDTMIGRQKMDGQMTP